MGVLVNYIDRVNISVSYDALHADFGISAVGFGYLLGAFNWTYAFSQLPVGVLLDRFGVKRIGRIGSFLWSLASFGAALSPGIASFFVMRLLLGLGEAPTFPANAKAIDQWFPRNQRGLPTAIFDAAAKFGPAIGVPLVGVLLIHFGWRWSFAASGALSFLYFGAFCLFYKDNPSAKKPGTSRDAAPESAPLTFLLKQPKVIGLVTGFFGYNYCFYLLLLWLPTYFSMLHLDALHAAFYSAVPWLFATLTDLFIGGFLVDHLIRRGRDQTKVRLGTLIGGTLAGSCIAGAILTNSSVIALIWLSISLGGLSAAAPVGWSIPALIAPRGSVGKVGSILNTGNQLAGIVAPIITGYILSWTKSFAAAFGVAASLLLAGIFAYLFLLRSIEPVPEPASQCSPGAPTPESPV
ncbi:MAG: MFS transporter [Acidobacteriaceae bacterium]|nr:MFS transporter [Acidobacteriaceae bacterium]